MNEKRNLMIMNTLKNIIYIYFNTFFAIYYFNLTNGDLLLFAKYFLIVSLVEFITYFLLSRLGKFDNRLYYVRISISLMALYLSMIIVLKEELINYYYITAIIYGLSRTLYRYPQSIKNNINYTISGKICSFLCNILAPILLGLVLSFSDYLQVSLLVFVLVLFIFLLSYIITDDEEIGKEHVLKFYKKIRRDDMVQKAMILEFLRGITLNSGVLSITLLLYEIIYFKTDLYIGLITGITSLVMLLMFILYRKIEKIEILKTINLLSLVLCVVFLTYFSINPNTIMLIATLIIVIICFSFANYMTDDYINSTASKLNVRFHQFEYHIILENILNISRCISFILLIFIGLTKDFDYLKCLLVISIFPITLYIIYVNKIQDKEIKKK